MKITRILICCLTLLLCSCTSVPEATTDLPQKRCNETIGADSSSMIDIVSDDDSDSWDTTIPEPIPPETEPITEPEPTTQVAPTETIPQPIEAEPPPPPTLPNDLHTNITDPEAAFILMEIYEAISSATDASVYFTDVEEEYRFGIGEETWYHTASTIKAVYCQYLLSYGIDPMTEVTLEQVNRTSSTGKLDWDDIGSTFTVGELIEYSIRYSDNQAHRLLYETFGFEDYNKYVATLGSGGLQMNEEWEWSRGTPKKLSRAMLDIYRRGEQDSILIDHLKNTTFKGQISAGTKYETAHKYGSNGGADGYHDMAIVYAPERAYVLTIMTHIDTAQTDDEDAVFRRVAELCDELHSILFDE